MKHDDTFSPHLAKIDSPVVRWIAVVLCVVLVFPQSFLLATQDASAGGDDAQEQGGASGRPSAERGIASALERVEEAEYEITWRTAGVSGGWQAPNRAHGFRTHFTDDAIRVVPRTEEQPTWEWELSLTGYGRGGEVNRVRPAIAQPDRNRVDYSRGEVQEWYVNDERGLEQGFTLAAPPEQTAAGAQGEAFLLLEMRGTLRPVLTPDGQAIDLFHPSSPLNVARFGKLAVLDATGLELPAWMELLEGAGHDAVRLVFDDRDAVYPVTVDPLLQAEAWSTQGNQTGAELGFSVAGAGDVNGDGFDDVLVGAPKFDAGYADGGRAFLFHGSASGVESYPAWTADSDQADAQFGYAVAGAGDVDADGYDDVVVGAPYFVNGETDEEGKFFLYRGSPGGLETLEAYSRELDNADALWGASVSAAGDVNGDGYADVVIGARNASYDESLQGVFAIYLGGPSLASPADYLTLQQTFYGEQADARLGQSVSAAGDVNGDGYDDVIVGAHRYTNGQNLEGKAYVYRGSSGGLVATALWSKEPDVADGLFGWSVAAAGDLNNDGYDDIVVGAPWGEDLGEDPISPEEGLAYVYHGSPAGPLSSPSWTGRGNLADAWFGSAVAGAGDVNGDGNDDLIVGAPAFARLFLGSMWDEAEHASGGLEDDFAWAVERVASDEFAYGAGVASAGDVNSDGFADVVVGSHLFTLDKPEEGRAVVYHGAEDAHADDLVRHALERLEVVCENDPSTNGDLCTDDSDCGSGTCSDDSDCENDPSTNGDLCTDDSDCGSGTCSAAPAMFGLSVWVYNDGDDDTVPEPLNTLGNNTAASPAVYYGSVPHSVVLSTGLAQDEGMGDTDWGQDGAPDLVRWKFAITAPEGSATLRFTTQFLTSDIDDPDMTGRTVKDSVGLTFQRRAGETTHRVNLDGVAGMGLRKRNSPVSHGIRVDDVQDIALVFEVEDSEDGRYDSALVVSNIYFSDIPLPEGADFWLPGDPPEDPPLPELLSNPSPQDTSVLAGTYSYDKTLYSVPGSGMPFEFSIRYNSASTAESDSLGPKWNHSYEATLQKAQVQDDPDGNTIEDDVDLVIVRLGSGLSEYFRCDEAVDSNEVKCTKHDSYAPKYAGTYSTLIQTEAGDHTASYTYETKDHVQYTYDLDLDYPDGETTDPYESFALTRIEDTNGNAITLSYTDDTTERIDWVVDTRGEVFTFNYDSDGRLTSVENPQGGGSAVTFEHETAVVDGKLKKLLTSFTDLNGFPTTFTYDKKANILTCTDADDVTFVTNVYEEYVAGSVKEQIGVRVLRRLNANPDDQGREFTLTGETVRTTDRDDLSQADFSRGVTISRYDVKGRLYDQTIYLGTDPTGECADPTAKSCWAVSASRYEKLCVGGDEQQQGQPCDTDSDCPLFDDPGCRADPDCRSTCGSTGNPVLQIDPLGHETEMTYDKRGNLELRIDSVGVPDEIVHTKMLYDDYDNLLYRAIRPRGGPGCLFPPAPCADISGNACYIEAYCYDGNHNRTHEYDSEGDPAVERVLHGFDAQGLETERTNRRGFLTEYEYDTRGYRTKVTGPADVGQPVTEYDYDEFGRRTWKKDPRDHESWFVYDPGGRLLEYTDALYQTTSYTYDVHDRMLSMTYPDGRLETYDYTPTGRLSRSATPVGAVDAGECVGGANDGDACTPDSDCDPPEGRCAVVVGYGYDAEDRLVEETDPLERKTQYTCDAADRLVGVSVDFDPAPVTASARYDKNGNMLGFTDPRTNETTFEYDSLGRVTKQKDPLDNEVVTTYDERGLVSKITRARGDTLEYTYDKAGRLLSVDLAPSGKSVEHFLDPNGNREETEDSHFSDGPDESKTITRTFDAYDRLKTRTDHFGNTIEYDYDLAGNIIALCYDYDTDTSSCEAGNTVTYSYDALNRLTGVVDWNGRQATYGYDASGNLISTTLPDGSQLTYTYDAGHRLTAVGGPVYQASFTRNATGAITAAYETLPLEPGLPEEQSFTYDAANQLEGYDHDDDGNMEIGTIGGEARSFGYDELNRLTSVDSDTYTYRYDADGQRVEVTTNGVKTRYVFDPNSVRPRLLEEQRLNGAVWETVARYVHGLGLILREEAGAGYQVYHYDVRGSTVALTDDAGTVTDAYAYGPYGRLAGYDRQSPGEPTLNPFRYNGRDGVFDDDNGLYFMRTRYYAPELMRFIQRDQAYSGTLADPQSLNRYAYVRGDPIRFVDPDGESFWGKIGLIAAIVGVAALAVLALPAVAAAGAAAAAAAAAGTAVAASAAGVAFAAASAIGAIAAVVGLAAAAFDTIASAQTKKDHQDALDEKDEEKKTAIKKKNRTIEDRESQLAEWSRNDLQTQLDAPGIGRPEGERFVETGFRPPDRGAPPPGTGASATAPARPTPCR